MARKKSDDLPESDAVAWPAGNFLLCLKAVDERLQAIGEHAISPWWWQQLSDFYSSQRWRFVGRVGRRGGKSDTWAKVAIAEVVSERFKIPLGDTGIVSVVSVDREEAAKRIKTIAAYCQALGIRHEATAMAIQFPGRPYAVEVKTASVRGVSGFTSILCIGDEVDKWKDADTGANPADAVLSSWTPTLATMLPHGAKMALLSSPWLYDGPHSREFERGTTASQQVAYAPTWLAHPSMTRELCEQLEPDPIKLRREYEAIPQPDGGTGVSKEQIERARRQRIDRHPADPCVAVLSQDRADPVWRLLVVGRRRDDAGVVRTAVYQVREWPVDQSPRPVFREVGKELARFGLEGALVPADTSTELVRIASRLSVGLSPCDVTADMHGSLRVRFADDGVELPAHVALESSVLSVRKHLTPEGARYEASGFAVLLALAAAKATAGPADRDAPTSRAVTIARAAMDPEVEDAPEPVDDGTRWIEELRAAAGYE